jgi:hypothetical protein
MRLRAAALLTALACTALVASPPASAATKTFKDARGDVRDGNDILRTKVTNGDRIGVKITHRDLNPRAMDIQFTIRTTDGPGWTVYAAFDGTFATLYRDGTTRECPELEVDISQKKNTTSLSVPRSCVDDPAGKIQLKARVQWSYNGTQGDDAINGHGRYTGWVKR